MQADNANAVIHPAAKQQQLRQVATNLFRTDTTSIYYAILRARGKQYHRSLKTTDKALARRRLEDLRQKLDHLSTTDGEKLPFAEYDDAGKLIGGLAQQWIDIAGTEIEHSTKDRYLKNIKQLFRSFHGLTAGNIDLKRVEQWAKNRTGCSANTFSKELGVLRRVLDYDIKHGYLLDNPARKIKRRKGHKKQIEIPSRDQF